MGLSQVLSIPQWHSPAFILRWMSSEEATFPQGHRVPLLFLGSAGRTASHSVSAQEEGREGVDGRVTQRGRAVMERIRL